MEASKRNGKVWMVAFFLMLLLFECTREWAVIQSDDPIPNAYGEVVSDSEGVDATGEWVRVDGGLPIARRATQIICREEQGICIEATSNSYVVRSDIYAPDIDIFKADFSIDAVKYSDPSACVTSDIRIDRKNGIVISTQTKNQITDEMRNLNPNVDANCASPAYKYKVVKQLKKSEFRWENPSKKHFVPIFALLLLFESNG